MDVCSGRFDTMRAWQLREFHAVSNHDARTIQLVQSVRRKVTGVTAGDMVNLLPVIARQDRLLFFLDTSAARHRAQSRYKQ